MDKMPSSKVLFLLVVLPLAFGQEELVFPDDAASQSVLPVRSAPGEASPGASPAPPDNVTQVRETTVYEEYVNRIISSGILNFTLAVDRAISTISHDRYDNIVFAPVSIAAALALVLLGSNGKTFDELSTVMGLTARVDIHNKSQLVHEQFGRILELLQATSGFDIGTQVNFATAIFVQDDFPIRRAYKQTAESVYESEVLNVDFGSNPASAQQAINAWVSDRTRGKITQLLKEKPSEATKVILASAMYFKAQWEKPFFDGSTRRRPFYTNGRHAKSDVMVEMMSNGGEFPYYKDSALGCDVIGFPYRGNHTTMYVVVPHQSDRAKLGELEARLTPAEVERLVGSVRYTGAIVLFPRMKIDSTLDLRRSLQMLGIRSLFNPQEANLAVLSPGTAPLAGIRPETALRNPISVATEDGDDSSVLIFTRSGVPVNCTQIFDLASNVTTCQSVDDNRTVVYKKFGTKVGRRVTRRISPRISESLDAIREHLNQQADPGKFENPGLYVDNVIHKVYMDITESGTEAAAATAVSLSRDGGRVTVRVDVPFLFFILHEQTKTVLFWGSVHTPSPSFG